MKITVIECSTTELAELIGVIEPSEPFREPTTKEIREWARSEGIPVSNKGYLPNDVVELYTERVIYGRR